jgi:hypothetical protein
MSLRAHGLRHQVIGSPFYPAGNPGLVNDFYTEIPTKIEDFPAVFELEGNPAFDCSCPYIYTYIYIHIVTGRAPSDKTKTTFKWESQLLMDVLTLSTPDRPTAKQSLVLACTNVSCRGFELLLPTGLASPK